MFFLSAEYHVVSAEYYVVRRIECKCRLIFITVSSMVFTIALAVDSWLFTKKAKPPPPSESTKTASSKNTQRKLTKQYFVSFMAGLQFYIFKFCRLTLDTQPLLSIIYVSGQ
jgi:Na+/H+ antiporter NhaD/arsenite permease-like protein